MLSASAVMVVKIVVSARARHGRASLIPARPQPSESTASRRSPRGVGTLTVSPCFAPLSACASGDSNESLPSDGFASNAGTSTNTSSRPDASSFTFTRLPSATTSGGGGAVLHVRAQQLLPQRGDARLEVRLLVLGVVVLGVLLEVAPLARGLDAVGDLASALRLEPLDFLLERSEALGGHGNAV